MISFHVLSVFVEVEVGWGSHAIKGMCVLTIVKSRSRDISNSTNSEEGP